MLRIADEIQRSITKPGDSGALVLDATADAQSGEYYVFGMVYGSLKQGTVLKPVNGDELTELIVNMAGVEGAGYVENNTTMQFTVGVELAIMHKTGILAGECVEVINNH